jgi:hypothetical protein
MQTIAPVFMLKVKLLTKIGQLTLLVDQPPLLISNFWVEMVGINTMAMV